MIFFPQNKAFVVCLFFNETTVCPRLFLRALVMKTLLYLQSEMQTLAAGERQKEVSILGGK